MLLIIPDPAHHTRIDVASHYMSLRKFIISYLRQQPLIFNQKRLYHMYTGIDMCNVERIIRTQRQRLFEEALPIHIHFRMNERMNG
jgi:hypothetical protein